MVRRYQEPIEVRAGEGVAGSPDIDRGGDIDRGRGVDVLDPPPTAFLWRGRLYIVREVIGHWRERRPWWRDALDPHDELAAQGLGSPAQLGLEHEVWRVEASPGRLAGIGVYDLGKDGDLGLDGSTRGWRLLRVAD
jgi:hypothetical protein